jgi:hypothetical protein
MKQLGLFSYNLLADGDEKCLELGKMSNGIMEFIFLV